MTIFEYEGVSAVALGSGCSYGDEDRSLSPSLSSSLSLSLSIDPNCSLFGGEGLSLLTEEPFWLD